MSEKLLSERSGELLIITLNDPAVRNAMTKDMRIELEGVVDKYFEDASMRAMLITGAAGFFCAGGDVRSFTEVPTPGANRTRLANSHRLMQKMMRVEKPIIAAVNGPAVGAGFGLAMMADITIAAESSFFLPAFSAVGLAPDWALAKTLPRSIGEKRAMDILLNNRKVSANQALEMGLVSRLYTDSEFAEKSLELAHQMASGPTAALGMTKVLVQASAQTSMSDFLHIEASCQAVAMGSEDHREGVKAFLDKRKPKFTGA